MFYIDHDSKSFSVKLACAREDFQEHLDFMKLLFMRYSGETRLWYWDKEEKIDEFLMWAEKNGFHYEMTTKAIEALDKVKQKYYGRELVVYRNLSFDQSILNPSVIPYNFQIEGIDWMLKRSRAYCADDPGLGKTFQAICVVASWFKEGVIDSCIFLVRTGLEYHWLREIEQFVNTFNQDDIAIINNTNKYRPFQDFQNKKILIIPNHLFGFCVASYKKSFNAKKALSSLRWSPSFVSIKEMWAKNKICLVVDEAHEIKNSSAVRTKAVVSTKHDYQNRIFLSATPAINKFEDWYMGMHLTDASIIPMTEKAFKLNIAKQIGDEYNAYNITEYNAQKVAVHRERMQKYILKRLKKDLEEMKYKQVIKAVYLEFPEKMKKLYNTFMKEEIEKIEREFDIITTNMIFNKFSYLLQIIDNPFLIEGKVINATFDNLLSQWKIDDDPRMQYLRSAVQEYVFLMDEKIVIFDNHPKTLDMIEEEFISRCGILKIHGQMGLSTEARNKIIEEFNDPASDKKILLMTTQIGGAGWNLNKACHRLIFWSLPFDTTLYRQAIDRIYRINNEHDAIVEVLLIDKTIDNIRYNRNSGRIELNDSILNRELTQDSLRLLLDGIL